MRKEITKESYYKRIHRVIDYIYEHLDEDLNYEDIAEVACLSPYHWHRIYRSITRETVQATIRRMRLQRAAVALISTTLSIERIARQAQYSNTDSFIRSFSKNFGIPPNAYRQEDKLTTLKLKKCIKEKVDMYQVEVKTINDISLGTFDHTGDYMKIDKVFDKLVTLGTTKELLDENSRFFGIYYDDPETVEENNLRSKAGFTVASNFIEQDNIKATTIEGGKYAVLTYKGPYSKLMDVYYWLFGIWLPESNEEPKDAPAVEEYLNDSHTVPANDLLTTIYLPLK